MLTLTQKSILFIAICLPIRLSFLKQSVVYPNDKYTDYLAYFFLLAGIITLYLYAFNRRLKSFESGGNTWWHKIRPIFAILWLSFSTSVFFGYRKYSYIFLLGDVVLGLTAFIVNLVNSLI